MKELSKFISEVIYRGSGSIEEVELPMNILPKGFTDEISEDEDDVLFLSTSILSSDIEGFNDFNDEVEVTKLLKTMSYTLSILSDWNFDYIIIEEDEKIPSIFDSLKNEDLEISVFRMSLEINKLIKKD